MSCQQSYVVDYEFESRLVLNGIFSPQNDWEIHLSNSRNILDSESQISGIEGASVVIRNLDFDTTESIILSDMGNGFYRTPRKPEMGINYSISITKGGYRNIYASAKAPTDLDFEFLEINSIDTTTRVIDGKSALQVNFKIEDNGNADNFYMWDLILQNPESLPENESFLPTNDAWLESIDPLVDPLLEEAQFQSKLFITDDDFNGQGYNTSFLSFNQIIQKGYPSSKPLSDNIKPELKLRVLSVSQDLYNYFKSVETYHQSQSINTSVVNPTEIRTNVENGLGIFGSYRSITIEI